MSTCKTSTKATTLCVDHADMQSISIRPKRPEQRPLSVTLSGKALTAALLVITALSHQQTLHLARLLLLLTPLILFIYNDYRNFLLLGPGGIPSTPRGYLKATWLSAWALKDRFEPPPAKPQSASSLGILAESPLPLRRDARPITAGIAPHRQITQHGSTECFQALQQTLRTFASMNPSAFEAKTSLLEKHGLALFAKHQPAGCRGGGEICHVHDTDHSLHMFLHPDDIKEVLEKGWGERHPMAWEWGPWKPVVGPYSVMIYAPRNESELKIVAKIVEAAAWNVSGEEIRLYPYIPSV